MTGPTLPDPLALFALRTVLFPDARLSLKVFEARYVDLVTDCLRSHVILGRSAVVAS